MADYPITAVTRRKVFSGSAGVGPYAFTFPILVQTDIVVYKNATLLTLTTDYTVTINGTNGTGSVTLVSAATGADTITIIGARAIQRTTDFVTAGDLAASSLNEQLDANIIMTQQLAEENKRTLKAPPYDPEATTDGGTLNMTLPAKASRTGRVLAFNETTGNPEAGPTIAAVGTVAGNTASINTVATNIASVNTVAGNTSNINTVAGVSGNVTTVASNIANVNTVASDLNEPVSEINTVATSIANVDAVGGSISNVNTVAGQISPTNNLATVAGDSANISTVAGSIANVNTAATNIASINTNATNIASINTNATNIVAIQNAASNASAAAASAASAAASFDAFDDRYLGAKASDPSVDNDGNPLITGALYFNTTNNTWRVWNGTGWDNGVTNVSGFMPLAGGTFTGGVTFSQPSTVSVSSASDAIRITQTGAGNALVVEDSANPDATPTVINASGSAVIGYTTPINVVGEAGVYYEPSLTTVGNGTLNRPVAVTQWGSNSARFPQFTFAKSLSNTIGTYAQVVNATGLGRISFDGDDGTAFIRAAEITAQVDGTPGTGDMPGRLMFSTTADGASTPTERMRITNAGGVSIGTLSAGASTTLRLSKNLTGSTQAFGALHNGTVQPDVTGTATFFSTDSGTANNGGTPYTITNFKHYSASQGTFDADSTVTNQYGFIAESDLIGATNDYGFYGSIASGTGRWNFYAAGTADNYFAGQVQLGAGSAATPALSAFGDTNTGIFFPAADTVAISAAGAEDFRIGPAGQIGIQGANYGTSGQVLTSGGASAAPTWTTPAAAGFSNWQVFTANGTFTVPSGITKVKATVVGGGGGGGGGGGNGSGGGGGGGAAIRIITGLTPGSTVTVTVGTAGTGTSGTGNTGGTSSFGSHCSATGGAGGTSWNAGAAGFGGTGGSGSSGDLNMTGVRGGDGGANGSLPYFYGFGGNSPLFSGAGSTGWSTGARAATTNSGAGGSGSYSGNGANGAAGIVIVEW